MPFKSAAEMFGDGGGFGPAVPYSTSNPPGTSAGNRGIQFGEQLTAAIANRTSYALAENTDDLNTRLVAFETGGINGAYDNGTVGPAGGGRDVTKDAGAIETVSAHASVAGDATRDNAHFRANALGDSAGASVGFDFTARRVGANGQSGYDAVAGVLDRRVLAKASGLTVLTNAVAATLNPGGALPTTVRLSAGQFHSGGDTDLARSYDLVEISGDTAADGIYIFSNVGGLTTDAILEAIDGTTPAFPANLACTVTVYRVRLGSFGSFSNRGRLNAAVVVGMPGATSALDVVPGRNQTDTTDGGAERALRVMRKSNSGSTTEAAAFDFLGRLESSLERTDIIDEVDRNARLGNYMAWKTHGSNPGVGVIVHSYDASIENRFDLMSLVPVDPAVSPAITPNTGVTMAFTADSPVTGELRFNAPQDGDLPNYILGVGMFVEISGAGTSDGLYYVAELTLAGNGGFLLRKADGTVPAHFPVGGTCTLVAVYVSSGIGRVVNFPNAQALTSSPATIRAYNVLTNGPEADATALAVFSANQVDSGNRAFVRMFASSPASGDHYQEKFSIDALGEVRARGAIYTGEGSASSQGFVIGTTNVNAEFRYGTARTRTLLVSLHSGKSFMGVTTSPAQDWFLEDIGTYEWTALAVNGQLYFSLNDYLRDGMVITNVEVIAKRPTAVAGITASLRYAEPDFGTLGNNPVPTTIVASQTGTATSAVQNISLAGGLGGGHTVDRDARDYFLRVQATSIGDRLFAVRLTVTDPGPRNF
jgi:hypothetical protein